MTEHTADLRREEIARNRKPYLCARCGCGLNHDQMTHHGGLCCFCSEAVEKEVHHGSQDTATARIAALTDALRRLDAIARVDPLNETGEAEMRAALDQSYWLLHPDQRPSALDKAARADSEARAVLSGETPDRQMPDWPPRYQWTETGMVLDSNGAYVLAHTVLSGETRTDGET